MSSASRLATMSSTLTWHRHTHSLTHSLTHSFTHTNHIHTHTHTHTSSLTHARTQSITHVRTHAHPFTLLHKLHTHTQLSNKQCVTFKPTTKRVNTVIDEPSNNNNHINKQNHPKNTETMILKYFSGLHPRDKFKIMITKRNEFG